MTSRRITGGMYDFVDKGLHEGSLTPEEEAKMDDANDRARKRRSTWRYKVRKFFTGRTD